MDKSAFAVEVSRNSKIGSCSTTYAALSSCPNSCTFKKNGGCYGMHSHSYIYFSKLKKINPLSVAKQEATAILRLSGNRPLRIHTVGDCSSRQTARIVSKAAERYMERKGQYVWTFTHGWKKTPREAWGKVSVLASCETFSDVKKAQSLGYATAIVVEKFQSEKAYIDNGIKIIPCPQQTNRAENCKSCKLCFRDEFLINSKSTIGLQVHGQINMAKNAIRKSFQV